MSAGRISRETMLEIGLAGFLLSLIAGVAVLVGGRVVGSANRENEKNHPPPGPGDVGPGRHRNIANSSAR